MLASPTAGACHKGGDRSLSVVHAPGRLQLEGLAAHDLPNGDRYDGAPLSLVLGVVDDCLRVMSWSSSQCVESCFKPGLPMTCPTERPRHRCASSPLSGSLGGAASRAQSD